MMGTSRIALAIAALAVCGCGGFGEDEIDRAGATVPAALLS